MNHHHHHHNHFEQVREADVCLKGMTNWSQLGAAAAAAIANGEHLKSNKACIAYS